MKKLRFLIIGLLSMFLILQSITVFALQSTTFGVEFSTQQVEQGREFTATVKIGKLSSVAAINCKLTYDKSKVTVIGTDVMNSEFSDALVANNSAYSTVTYVWDSATNESTESGKLFSVNFRVLSNAPLGNAAFNLEVTEIFTASLARIETSVTANSGVNITEKTIPQKVLDTIALIDSIGVVDTSPETLEKINAALAAYNSLNSDEKSQITNYTALADAFAKYNELRAQEEAEKDIANNKKIIDDFKAREVLKKTTETVALSDEIAVLDALNYYDMQSTYIRSQLQNEASLLKSLKARISEIKEDVSAKDEAAQQVKDFIAVYEQLLKTPVQSIFINNELKTKIDSALMTYEMLNEYAQQDLSDEIAHVKAQLERYTELEILNAPESEVVIRAANEFKEKYRRILSLSEADVTEADKAEINQAIDELKGYSNELKGKLVNQLEKLNGLLFALTKPEGEVIQLPGETVTLPGDSQVVYVETQPEKVEEVKKAPVKVKHIGNKTLVILVIVLAFSMLGLAASAVIYMYIKRKELSMNGKIEEE